MTREVAAVDRRHVAWQQWLQRLRVVPVEEVPLMALELRHRRQRVLRALEQLSAGDVAEVVRGEIGEQRQAYVRRRRPMGDDFGGMLLEVVGRQPVVLGTDEYLEEPPRLARH